MKKAELQEYLKASEDRCFAAEVIAESLFEGDARVTRALKGRVKLVTARTAAPHGGVVMLAVHLPENRYPHYEYGYLDALARRYYEVCVHGGTDPFVMAAVQLLSRAVRERDSKAREETSSPERESAAQQEKAS